MHMADRRPIGSADVVPSARYQVLHRALTAPWLLIVVFGLTTLALALASLSDRSLWLDEAFTTAVATAPAGRFMDDLTFNGGNMSLYLVFMRGWLVAGDSDWWIRLPSALFASACVPCFFAMARRFVDRGAAVAGAGLLAISPPLLLHSQEARSYSLTVLLAILSWWAAVRLWDDQGTTATRWYVVAATALIYSHIIGVLMVVGQLLWLLAGRRRHAMLAAAYITLLVSPQVAAVARPSAADPGWIPPTTSGEIGATLRFLTGTEVQVLAAAVAVTWVWGALAARNRGDHRSLAPVAWVVVPFFGLLSLAELSPLLVPRYLLMIVPGAILLVSMRLEVLKPRFSALLLVGLLAITAPGLWSTVTRDDPDWREATRRLLAQAEPDEAVLFVHSRQLIEHYWDELGRPSSVPRPLSSPQRFGDVRRRHRYEWSGVRHVLESSTGAWVVSWRQPTDLEPIEIRTLEEIERRWPARSVRALDRGGIVIMHYTTNDA